MIQGHDIHNYLGIKGHTPCPGVYVGFQEINGHRAPTKVGKSTKASAIQRGRAQGGAKWWFVSYFLLPTSHDASLVEKEWSKQMKSQNIVVKKAHTWSYAPRELYYLSLDDAVDELEALLISMGYEVRDLVDEILEDQLHEQLD